MAFMASIAFSSLIELPSLQLEEFGAQSAATTLHAYQLFLTATLRNERPEVLHDWLGIMHVPVGPFVEVIKDLR
jgi:hypothetical protein